MGHDVVCKHHDVVLGGGATRIVSQHHPSISCHRGRCGRLRVVGVVEEERHVRTTKYSV